MSCPRCNDRPYTVVGSYPADMPNAAMAAAHVATADQLTTGADTHMHHVARGDKYVVVRPEKQEVPA